MSTLTGLRPTKQRWLMIGLGLTGLLLYARHFHSRDVKHHRFEAAVNKMKDMPVEMGPEATAFNLSGRSLFVSYHGVLTLVYDGWSPAAMAVKVCLPTIDLCCRLPKSNLTRHRMHSTDPVFPGFGTTISLGSFTVNGEALYFQR